MVSNRRIQIVMLVSLVLYNITDLVAFSRNSKIALASSIGLITVGGACLYGYYKQKKVADCKVRVEEAYSSLKENYAEQLTIIAQANGVMTTATLDKLAESLKTTYIHDYLTSLSAVIKNLKADLHCIAGSSEAIKQQELIDRIQKFLAKLIVLESSLTLEQHYFLKHSYSDRQCIGLAYKRIQEIKESYGMVLDMIDIGQHPDQLLEPQLAQISNELLVVCGQKDDFMGCLACILENVTKELHFITTQSTQWQKGSSLCLSADELKPLYSQLADQLKQLLAIFDTHRTYFALNYWHKQLLKKYGSIDQYESIHEFVIETFPHSSVTYPYLRCADSLLEDIGQLRKALEELKNFASYDGLAKSAKTLLDRMLSFTKKVTQSNEFQRQKEAHQESLQAQEALAIQRQLVAVQQENTIMERERLRQSEAHTKELERAHALQEEKQKLQLQENELKVTILREFQPQSVLLQELRDLLRKIHESPHDPLALADLNRIIDRLRFIHEQFMRVGVSFAKQ